MKEAGLPDPRLPLAASSFRACLATLLELPADDVPAPPADADAAGGRTISRWLGILGLAIAPVAEPSTFSWPGPWIARAQPPSGEPRYLVRFGVPSGVVWDPGGDAEAPDEWITDGFVLAPADVALALPPRAPAPTTVGRVEAISVAPTAGARAEALDAVEALAGQGLAGDRHVTGAGTFPSGLAGSALTLIEAEVCDSFDPPLEPGEHRRNVVTRGIDLNALVGVEFTIGEVPCRGMRLCEPCVVAQRYAARPVLRQLVHRGGLRADILGNGVIRLGDPIRATT